MSDVMEALRKDDPRMIAWEKYKATEDYANTKKWAKYDAHVDGSLWAAFLIGYGAALAAKSTEQKEEG